MCDHGCASGKDCAHDRDTDTWIVPADLRPRFQAPTPPLSRDGGESETNR